MATSEVQAIQSKDGGASSNISTGCWTHWSRLEESGGHSLLSRFNLPELVTPAFERGCFLNGHKAVDLLAERKQGRASDLTPLLRAKLIRCSSCNSNGGLCSIISLS